MYTIAMPLLFECRMERELTEGLGISTVVHSGDLDCFSSEGLGPDTARGGVNQRERYQ